MVFRFSLSLEQVNGYDKNAFWNSFGYALSLGSENRFFDSCVNITGAHLFQKAFVIHAIVIIGTFSILHLDSGTSSSRPNLVSPFNVNDPVQNPNFSLKEVQTLFGEFENENKMKIEDEVITNIYTQTNGYVKVARLKYKFSLYRVYLIYIL